jgi:hypothetical protein
LEGNGSGVVAAMFGSALRCESVEQSVNVARYGFPEAEFGLEFAKVGVEG